MISIYLFRSLRDSNSTTTDEVDQLTAAAAHDVNTRAHTHTRSQVHSFMRSERDSTATRDDDCPYRRAGEYCVALWRWAIVGDRWSARAEREMPPPPRRAACHALDETQCKFYGRYMIIMILMYCSRHALRHSCNYNKYYNKITIIIIFRPHNIVFGAHHGHRNISNLTLINIL